MSEEYDAKRIFKAVIFFIAAVVVLVYAWPLVFGQVEVKQSVTTNDNKASASICQGLPNACNEIIKLNGLTVTETHGGIIIHYCKHKCHAYRLADNGTITEVK